MELLYDHCVFEQQITGGVSRYFTEIISEISKEHQVILPFEFSNNIHLKRSGLKSVRPIVNYRQEFLPGLEFKGKGRLFSLVKSLNPGKYPDPYAENKNKLLEYLKTGAFDVFHPTTYDPYFLDFIGNKPFVLTVHDMIHELFPEFIHKDDINSIWKKKLVNKAEHIIAVSENTKKDLTELLKVSSEKITVIYHGTPSVRETRKKIIETDYLLYVGDRHGYKNFLFLIFSIADLLKSFDLKLICTGMPFNKVEKNKFEELGVEKNIMHYSASDEEIFNLYRNAIAFIFPSLYEGFGFPIVEAFECDCPVILARASCFNEIAGNAALYFNPKSKDEIYSQVKKVIEDTALREELKLLGKKRKELFTWEKAGRDIISVYNQVSLQK